MRLSTVVSALGFGLFMLTGPGCASAPVAAPPESAFLDHREFTDWSAAESPASAPGLFGTWQPTGQNAGKFPDLYRFSPDGTFAHGDRRAVVKDEETPFRRGAYRLRARPEGQRGEILLHVQHSWDLHSARAVLQRIEYEFQGDELVLTFALGSPSTNRVTVRYARIDRSAS